jgi:hypothetical protein
MASVFFRPLGSVVRAPAGEQRFENLVLRRGFDQQGAEQTLQTLAVQPGLQCKQLPEPVDLSRANRHTVDPQSREEVAKLRQWTLSIMQHDAHPSSA